MIYSPRRGASVQSEQEGSIVADVALPIVLGTAAGIGTGFLIFAVAVARLGLMAWIWP